MPCLRRSPLMTTWHPAPDLHRFAAVHNSWVHDKREPFWATCRAVQLLGTHKRACCQIRNWQPEIEFVPCSLEAAHRPTSRALKPV